MTERLEPLLYIAGYGHSGSTLLNIMLGQAPGIMGAGELFRLAGAARAGDERCSCGPPVRACPVWREVLPRWARTVDEPDPLTSYRRLQRHCETFLPGIAARERDAYARHTRALLGAVREVTGRPVVVDSSKLPGRAHALAQVPGIDLRLVHLVRDGRGVAWSLRHRRQRDPGAGLEQDKRARSVVRTGLLWMAANLATERVARRLGPGRSIRLTYEELVREPKASLNRIGRMIGTDLDLLATGLATGRPLAAGHVMAGNRLRMRESLLIEPDTAWEERLPHSQRRVLEHLCRPLLRRYGYLGSAEPPAWAGRYQAAGQ